MTSTSPFNIPDDAVYAAAAAVYGGEDGLDGSPHKDAWLADFRKALEAAAPHLMAAAWDEGYLAMVDDAFRDRELVKKGSRLADDAASSNPYKKDEDAK